MIVEVLYTVFVPIPGEGLPSLARGPVDLIKVLLELGDMGNCIVPPL